MSNQLSMKYVIEQMNRDLDGIANLPSTSEARFSPETHAIVSMNCEMIKLCWNLTGAVRVAKTCGDSQRAKFLPRILEGITDIITQRIRMAVPVNGDTSYYFAKYKAVQHLYKNFARQWLRDFSEALVGIDM